MWGIGSVACLNSFSLYLVAVVCRHSKITSCTNHITNHEIPIITAYTSRHDLLL